MTGVFPIKPLADLLAVEAPNATDFEGRELTIFQKSVNGNPMNMKLFGNLGHCLEMRV